MSTTRYTVTENEGPLLGFGPCMVDMMGLAQQWADLNQNSVWVVEDQTGESLEIVPSSLYNQEVQS